MRYIISFLLASTAPALAEVPRVVTDLPPVHALVAQVMGDLGEPELLLEKGANAHDFQLRPSQAAGLQAADLVVWIGPEMTPWLDRALQGLSGAEELRLLQAEGTYRQSFDAQEPHGDHDGHGHSKDAHDEATAEDGHDKEGHDHSDEAHDEAKTEEGHDEEGHDEAGHDEAGHDHSGTDPHAWLDPENARHWLTLIAERLAAKDPEHAATYAANAAAAQAEIAALDAEIAATLAPVQGRALVVYHNAYGYFAGHYGLTIAASIAEGDATAPGARHIAKIEALLAAGPTCLFPETNHDPKLVTQLAEATGLVAAPPLDPEGALLDPGPKLYGQLMRALAQNIATCAG